MIIRETDSERNRHGEGEHKEEKVVQKETDIRKVRLTSRENSK